MDQKIKPQTTCKAVTWHKFNYSYSPLHYQRYPHQLQPAQQPASNLGTTTDFLAYEPTLADALVAATKHTSQFQNDILPPHPSRALHTTDHKLEPRYLLSRTAAPPTAQLHPCRRLRDSSEISICDNPPPLCALCTLCAVCTF